MRRREEPCPNCQRLEKRVQSLEATVAKLVEENKRLKAEIRTLQERVNTDSSNSSKPPSSDPPDRKRNSSKPKSKRNRGAQPGHPDQQRKLYPPDQVDFFVQCKPDRCAKCADRLSGEDPNPRRVQKTEMPEIKPEVTEFLVHTLECDCGHKTTGTLPADVGPGAFGPRIQAIVSLLSGAYRLSKREIEQLMSDLFNVEISLGSVCNLENATSQALEAPVEEAKAFVQSQAVAHLDETGWREAKKKVWLWAAVTAYVTVFLIRFSRGAKVAKELIGAAFDGIAHTDRWSGYEWIAVERRQICWAHLKRNFQKLVDRGRPSAEIGQGLLDCTQRLFEYWQRIRDGTLKRSTFITYMRKLRREVFALTYPLI
jgi:transposase